jgi:hypothetical protein
VAEQGWLDLAEVVRALRRELTAATAEGQDAEVRFELGPIELEFLVDIRREAGADAGVRFGVVSFGAKGALAAGSGHRVKLTLNPRDSLGRSPRVSARGDRIPDQ